MIVSAAAVKAPFDILASEGPCENLQPSPLRHPSAFVKSRHASMFFASFAFAAVCIWATRVLIILSLSSGPMVGGLSGVIGETGGREAEAGEKDCAVARIT